MDFARYSNTYVFADDLLLQVFVNIFSNAARYTDSNGVLIETRISERPMDGNGMQSSNIDEDRVPGKKFLKVSIIDHDRGVPDDQKDGLFTRYLKTAKGNGLGLSIIHALITTRYQGRVRFKNRVAGDYTQGTEVEVWLLKAE